MKPQCILVDIDGTIADIRHRAHLVNNPAGTKDWNAFNALMNRDIPKDNIIAVVDALRDHTSCDVIFVTGRFSQYLDVTTQWMHENHIIWDFIFMRPDGDYASDHEVKCKILHEKILPMWDVLLVLDDRDSVVAMWRQEGLTCLQVQKGDY